ncbi:MAG: lipid-A-disaccharide synthase N-terminal domain-containing protein [Planctomycetaceae bacterium]
MQWVSSEREKRSVVPPSFWYFSIGGASMLLTYAIYKQDIVFIFGQSSAMFIYVRNLQLIRSERKRLAIQNAANQESETIPMTAERTVASTGQQHKAA